MSAPPLGCQFVFDGSVAESLHCVAMGYPNPRLSWTKNGVAVYAVEYNVSGTNNAVASNLTLDAVSVSDSGTYTCTASNGIGKPAVAESIVLVDGMCKQIGSLHSVLVLESDLVLQLVYLSQLSQRKPLLTLERM